MRREDRDGVLVLGHAGRPVLVFPSQERTRYEWEEHGMVDAVRDLVDAGRVTFWCVETWDWTTWCDGWLPLEERGRRYETYERWLLDQVDGDDVIAAGVSMGGYHAANLALRHSERFPLALSFSGIFDISRFGWGERGDAVYFNNPVDYVQGLDGSQASLLLVVGRGMWEDTTGALPDTLRFAELLRAKGIRHELDVWGEDAPHDWPAWRAQLAKHLPRFVLRSSARLPSMTPAHFVGAHAAVAAALCDGASFSGPEPEEAVAEALDEVDVRFPAPAGVVDTDRWNLAPPAGLCLEEARELVAAVARKLEQL